MWEWETKVASSKEIHHVLHLSCNAVQCFLKVSYHYTPIHALTETFEQHHPFVTVVLAHFTRWHCASHPCDKCLPKCMHDINNDKIALQKGMLMYRFCMKSGMQHHQSHVHPFQKLICTRLDVMHFKLASRQAHTSLYTIGAKQDPSN